MCVNYLYMRYGKSDKMPSLLLVSLRYIDIKRIMIDDIQSIMINQYTTDQHLHTSMSEIFNIYITHFYIASEC